MPNELFAQLAPQMTSCLNEVALALGFDQRDITRFSPGDDNHTVGALTMLSEWYGNIPTEATNNLVQVFEELGKEDLAREVRRSGNNFSIYFGHIERLVLNLAWNLGFGN